MARLKIECPAQFAFRTKIPLRVTDLNYGNHVGNDRVLTLMHEARVQFLHWLGGYTELDMDGIGLIMTDAQIEFKREIKYGNELYIEVSPFDISEQHFSLIYRLQIVATNQLERTAALGTTGLFGYNYALQKLSRFSNQFIQKLSAL